MIRASNGQLGVFRRAVQLLIGVQGALIVWAVGRGTRFTFGSISQTGVAIVVACAYAVCALSLSPRARPWPRRYRLLALAPAMLITCRFYVPIAVESRGSPLRTPEEQRLRIFLRELSAAQEQFRLHQGRYANTIDPLRALAQPPSGSDVRLVAHGSGGWSARAAMGRAACSLWARDSTLRQAAWEPEGAPMCGRQEERPPTSVERTVSAPVVRETGFARADVLGTYSQHRGDAQRTGIAAESMPNAGFRWAYRVGGELRASAAVAGNQVFVGAHGNGELDVLSLTTGALGFRVRAPNWIHHEPAITADLVIVGFGGEAPHGVVAYDRRTGVERWRQYARGHVMTTPVVADSLVVVATGANEALGLRVLDGSVAWRSPLPSSGPMSNPLLRDSVLLVSLERTMVCALSVRTGARLFCRSLSSRGEGAGHSSLTSAGAAMLMVYNEDMSLWDAVRSHRWRYLLLHLAGFGGEIVRNQVVVAFDPTDGSVWWRLPLAYGSKKTYGHTAGTPAYVDRVAYVPSPFSGFVTAVRVDSGRLLWATDVSTARGSVSVTRGAVFAAGVGPFYSVLDAATGAIRCRGSLPGASDRAGLTIAGSTGVLTLRTGEVLARSLSDWLACHG